MVKTVQIAHNAVNAKLIGADRDIQLYVQRILSYYVQGYEQMASFRTSRWDGRSSFFELRTQKFPAGFVFLIQQKLTQMGITVRIIKNPLPLANGPIKPIFDEFGYNDPNYDYQLEVSNRLLRHGRFIAQVATGGGKSRIAQICVSKILRPTLFLTTRSVLMYQMKDHFDNMLTGLVKYNPSLAHLSKYNVGVIGDGFYEPRKMINVGMVQTIIERLKPPDPITSKEKQKEQTRIRNQTIKLLEMFEFVILEEAHEASGNSYYDILKFCKNAHYRLALTATPFMKEDDEANMKLMACAGPIGIKVSEEQLIKVGILAKPYFKYISCDRPDKLLRTTKWPRCYDIGVVNNHYRNDAIVKEAINAVKYNLPVVILVARQNHGKILRSILETNGIKTEYIFGDSDQLSRKRNLQKLASKEIQVLIGSTILDVGVDVPAIGMVIIASAGKAEVQVRQRIGRGLRRKSSGANVALIVDFMDHHNNILKKHAIQRRSIVASTPGFFENILCDGEDFNYEELGLKI